MKNEHLKILDQGVETWNRWRARGLKSSIAIEDINLGDRKLMGINFDNTRLYNCNLNSTILTGASLRNSLIYRCIIDQAEFDNVKSEGARISSTSFSDSNLEGTSLKGAKLNFVTFEAIVLDSTCFTEAELSYCVFADVDLQNTIGLESIVHTGPSTIGIDTVYKSKGKIPDTFLRGCGVPEALIEQIPGLIGAMEPIQYHSCFISYSHKDEEFAEKLHARMRQENLRVWFAPEEMKGGQMIHEQIHNAIQVHEKLLLILSPASMQSNWVRTEISRALKTERVENRRKLFPIGLVDFEEIEKWEFFDADFGADLAATIRKYYIPDFSKWKDHDAFEAAFARLLDDLRKS